MKRLTREYVLKAIKDNTLDTVQITNSGQAADYAQAFYGDDMTIYESVFILLLNQRGNTIGWAKISQGGLTCSIVDKRIICKYAIDALATGVILVHNHPSGSLRPSQEDKACARGLKEALKLLDVTLRDSIILTEDGSYSLYDNGDM